MATKYHPTYEAARDAARGVPERFALHVRLVEYGRGWAVQLHASGPYLGDCDPRLHECPWCPELARLSLAIEADRIAALEDEADQLWQSHLFVVHACNADEHGDGCDAAASPERVRLLDEAHERLRAARKATTFGERYGGTVGARNFIVQADGVRRAEFGNFVTMPKGEPFDFAELERRLLASGETPE